nr:S41 family peptidase [Rhodoferax sp.]
MKISVTLRLRGLVTSLLLPFVMLVHNASHGQEVVTTWKALELNDWKGKSSGGSGYDLEQGTANHSLPLDVVDGKWIRVTSSADAKSPDFKILISILDEQSRVISKNLPTLCEIKGLRKTCITTAWIQPAGASAKVTLYSNFLPVIAVPEKFEVALESQLRQENVSRFEDITSEMARLYFRTVEVDWPLIKSKVEGALVAPEEIDPIPYAIAQLVGRLPDSKHSAVYPTTNEQDSKPPVLPACKELRSRGSSIWRLDLPGTSGSQQSNSLYVRAATKCFGRPKVKQWIINLTENFGGDAMVMFAALSPLFKYGALMQFQNPNGGRFVVVKSSSGISLNGKLMQRVNPAKRSLRSKVLVVVNKVCASSCEAVAIALKGNHQIVGTSTAGFATANESLILNKRFALAITSGYMADAKGKVFSIVEPDLIITDEDITGIIKYGEIRSE